jgi:hypothetical protein
MALLTDAQAWALLLGLINIVVTAVVNRPHWPSWLRQLVAIGLALVLGFGDAVVHGEITDTTSVLTILAVVLGTSELAYRTVMSRVAAAIEKQTSPTIDGEIVGTPTVMPYQVTNTVNSTGVYPAAAPPSS